MLIFKVTSDIEKKYIFLHIPKNSGRYMRKEIKKKFNVFSRYDLIKLYFSEFIDKEDTEIPLEIQNILHNNHISYYKIKNYFNPEKIIVFVRNPYDRLLSGYFHILPHIKIGMPRIINKLKDDSLLIFTEEEVINYSKELSKENSIEDLKTHFKDITRLLKKIFEQNINIFFPFCQQYKYILEDDSNEELGISSNVTIYKLEEYETNTEAQNLFQFENFNIKKYNYADYYDNETLAIVNQIYKKDFDMFGYSMLENLDNYTYN